MLHIDFLVADVDVVLEVEEIAVADAEILAEAKGCVHRDLALVTQDFLNARYRHMDVFRQPVRRDPHRLHEFFPEDFRHGRGWNHIFHVYHLLVNDNLQSVRHTFAVSLSRKFTIMLLLYLLDRYTSTSRTSSVSLRLPTSPCGGMRPRGFD